jgi:aminopeptidase
LSDPRFERYAELLCAYSLEIEAGNRVLIDAPPVAEPLVLAVAREAWRRGGDVSLLMTPPETSDRRLRDGDDAQLAFVPRFEVEAIELADRMLVVWAPTNTASAAGVEPARTAVRARGNATRLGTLDSRVASGAMGWVGCAYPTAAAAQNAGLGTAAWERFVLSACLLDEPDPAAAWRARGGGVAARAARHRRRGPAARRVRHRHQPEHHPPGRRHAVRREDRRHLSRRPRTRL